MARGLKISRKEAMLLLLVGLPPLLCLDWKNHAWHKRFHKKNYRVPSSFGSHLLSILISIYMHLSLKKKLPLLRIHMTDFVCQCEEMSGLPSRAWERNLDLVELFSGQGELTNSFRYLVAMRFQLSCSLKPAKNSEIYNRNVLKF